MVERDSEEEISKAPICICCYNEIGNAFLPKFVCTFGNVLVFR